MTTLSVSVPDELKKKMDALDEVNWSAVARKAFEEKVRQVAYLQELAREDAEKKNGSAPRSRK